MGTGFVHTVSDDHSPVAYAEIHADEKAVTAIGVLARAVSWFAARGVRVERVLSHHGSAYEPHARRDACQELAVTAKKTGPYRPRTNGTIERLHRTMPARCAVVRRYRSETARRAALPAWLHTDDHQTPLRHRRPPTHHQIDQGPRAGRPAPDHRDPEVLARTSRSELRVDHLGRLFPHPSESLPSDGLAGREALRPGGRLVSALAQPEQ